MQQLMGDPTTQVGTHVADPNQALVAVQEENSEFAKFRAALGTYVGDQAALATKKLAEYLTEKGFSLAAASGPAIKSAA